MIVFRVWKDANKDNWQDATTIDEVNEIDFGFGYDEFELNNWSKEQHLAEIKNLMQQHLDNLAISKDYSGIIDVPTEFHIYSKWYEEAKELLEYSSNLWWKLEQYKENLTEETDLTAEQWLINNI